MSPDVSHARSSPPQSVTTPPASRTSTPPAATSQGRAAARSSRRTRPRRSTRGRGSRRRRGGGPRTCAARARTPGGTRRAVALGAEREPGRGDRRAPAARSLTRERDAVAERARRRARASTVSPSIGACTTPTIGTPSPTRRDRHTDRGKPCRKLAVPSSGSTNQPTSARSPPRLLAEERDLGRRLATSARTACSLAVSTSLTQSPGPFARALVVAPNASSTISPPARAAVSRDREQPIEIEVALTVMVAGSRRATSRAARGVPAATRLPAAVGLGDRESRP